MSLYHHTDEPEGQGARSLQRPDGSPNSPLGLYPELADEKMADGICTIPPEDMLSHLKNSHQRDSKLGLETAESRYGTDSTTRN